MTYTFPAFPIPIKQNCYLSITYPSDFSFGTISLSSGSGMFSTPTLVSTDSVNLIIIIEGCQSNYGLTGVSGAITVSGVIMPNQVLTTQDITLTLCQQAACTNQICQSSQSIDSSNFLPGTITISSVSASPHAVTQQNVIYTITFTPQHSITTSNNQILIIFPSSINLGSCASSHSATCSTGCQTPSCSISSHTLTLTNAFTSSYPGGIPVTVVVGYGTNPTTSADVGLWSIETKDFVSGNYGEVDIGTQSGLFTPSPIGLITPILAPLDLTVGTMASSLQVTYTVVQFLDATGGYIDLNCPATYYALSNTYSDYMFGSSIVCTPTAPLLTCSAVFSSGSNTVSIYYTMATQAIAGAIITFSLSEYNNPVQLVATVNPFQLVTYAPDNTIYDRSADTYSVAVTNVYTTTPTLTLGGCSTNTAQTFTFSLPSFPFGIEKNCFLRITFPSQISLASATLTTCSGTSIFSGATLGTLTPGAGGVIKINACTSTFGKATLAAPTLTLTKVITPTAVATTSNIQFDMFQDSGYLDQISTGVIALQASQLCGVVTVNSVSATYSYINGQTPYTIGFTIQTALTSTSEIIITLPTTIALISPLTYQFIVCTGTCVSTPTAVTTVAGNVITIAGCFSTPIPAGALSIQIFNGRNPATVVDVGTFAISTYNFGTSYYLADSGSASGLYHPKPNGVITPILTSSDNIVGDVGATLSIQFTVGTVLRQGGSITLLFPVYYMDKLPSVAPDPEQMLSGYTCTVGGVSMTCNYASLLLTVEYPVSGDVGATTVVTVLVAGFNNPISISTMTGFQLETFDSLGTEIDISATNQALATTFVPCTLASPTITIGTPPVVSTSQSISIQLAPFTVPIESPCYLTVTFPSSMTVPATVTVTGVSSMFSSNTHTLTPGAGGSVVIEGCSSTQYGLGSNPTDTITIKNIQLPSMVADTLPLIIMLSHTTGASQEICSVNQIIYSYQLTGVVTINSVVSSPNSQPFTNVNQPTSYTVTFTPNDNLLASSQITILFGEYISITTCQYLFNSCPSTACLTSPSVCTLTTVSSPPQSLITITDPFTLGFTGNNQLVVTISTGTNPPVVEDAPNFQIMTYNYIGSVYYLVDQSILKSGLYSPTPGAFPSGSVTPTTSTVTGEQSVYTFYLNMDDTIPIGGILQIVIPPKSTDQTGITVLSSPVCQAPLLTPTSLTCTLTGSTFTITTPTLALTSPLTLTITNFINQHSMGPLASFQFSSFDSTMQAIDVGTTGFIVAVTSNFLNSVTVTPDAYNNGQVTNFQIVFNSPIQIYSNDIFQITFPLIPPIGVTSASPTCTAISILNSVACSYNSITLQLSVVLGFNGSPPNVNQNMQFSVTGLTNPQYSVPAIFTNAQIMDEVSGTYYGVETYSGLVSFITIAGVMTVTSLAQSSQVIIAPQVIYTITMQTINFIPAGGSFTVQYTSVFPVTGTTPTCQLTYQTLIYDCTCVNDQTLSEVQMNACVGVPLTGIPQTSTIKLTISPFQNPPNDQNTQYLIATTYYDSNFIEIIDNTTTNLVPESTITCLSPCATCVYLNPYGCTSCLQNIPQKYLSNGNCITACPNGFFAGPGNVCAQCAPMCATCVTTASTCLTCSSSDPFYYLTACVPTCSNITYQGMATVSGSQIKGCIQCTSPCATCTSDTSCSSCISSYYLLVNKCVTMCPLTYFPDSGTSTCLQCPIDCNVCSNANKCTVCSAGFYLIHNSCTGSCPNGYSTNSQTMTCTYVGGGDNQPLSATITSVSNTGLATITFNQDINIPLNYTLFNSSVLRIQEFLSVTNNMDVNFTVQNIGSNTMTIQLNFANPSAISVTQIQTLLKISFVQPDYFISTATFLPIQQNYLITSALSPQLGSTSGAASIASAAAAASAVSKGVTIATLTLQIFMSASMSLLWGMINALQLVANLPLFNLYFPPIASSVFNQIVTFINFQIINFNEYIAFIFTLPNDNGYTANFNLMGYGSMMMFENGSQQIGMFLLYPIFVALTFILRRLAQKYDKLTPIYKWFDATFLYAFIIRYMIESNLELFLFSLVNVIGYRFDSYGTGLSTVFSFIFLVIYGVCPVGLFVFFNIKKAELSILDLKKKYGSLYEEVNYKRFGSVYYVILFVLRRMVFCLTVIIIPNYLPLQLQIYSICSLLNMTYLIKIKPFEDKLLNYQELFNEACVYVISLVTYVYSDYVSNMPVKENAGFFMTFMILINVVVNLGLIFKFMIGQVRELIGKMREKCKKNKAKKYEVAANASSTLTIDQLNQNNYKDTTTLEANQELNSEIHMNKEGVIQDLKNLQKGYYGKGDPICSQQDLRFQKPKKNINLDSLEASEYNKEIGQAYATQQKLLTGGEEKFTTPRSNVQQKKRLTRMESREIPPPFEKMSSLQINGEFNLNIFSNSKKNNNQGRPQLNKQPSNYQLDDPHEDYNYKLESINTVPQNNRLFMDEREQNNMIMRQQQEQQVQRELSNGEIFDKFIQNVPFESDDYTGMSKIESYQPQNRNDQPKGKENTGPNFFDKFIEHEPEQSILYQRAAQPHLYIQEAEQTQSHHPSNQGSLLQKEEQVEDSQDFTKNINFIHNISGKGDFNF